ncbi:LOW QUALITY PROTEIN: general transcription factor II-I repeat domain-containing protein 1 [Neosynchiropus ocellatus]
MAQIRKLACDGVRTNSRGEPPASARQEILTSLVSALDSVCMAMSKLNAEVACVTVHEDSVIAVGTEKGRVFLNSRREIQTDFYKFCRSTCLQNVNSSNSQAKDNEVDRSKPSKDGEHAKHRTTSEAQSNIFVLRKMVDEVFTVLYSEAVGKSSLVPVPYDWIQKEPGCLVAHGLPEGVVLKKPSEYDTKTLMKILEQSHRIQFSVKRPAEEPSRESKSSADLGHGAAVMPLGSHVTPKTPAHVVPPSSTPSSSNSVLSNFLYGMPMSSKPHPDGKLDFKPASILNLGKDRLNSTWADKTSKDLNSGTAGLLFAEAATKAAAVCDAVAYSDEMPRPPGDQNQSPTSVHISKRLLFSIVHEKSEKWDSFIRETEDINTLRECVQILFNSRYAEALGLDHMVPVPYRKIACDPGAVEIIGIPDQIPFKRPCTYGVPKLKRILDERHGIRFIVKRMFDERIFTAAGKLAREEGKYEPGCSPEEGFPDGLIIPPSTAEILSNSHSSRSASACVSPLADGEAVVKQSRTLSELLHPSAPPGDSVPLKKIKTEPPDGEVGQAAPEVGSDEPPEPPSDPPTSAAPAATSPSVPPAHLAPAAESHTGAPPAAEPVSPPAAAQPARRSSEGGSLVDDIGEMILQLRRQVESLFSVKYAEALGLSEPAKVPYSKFQMYPEELFVTGLPDGISLRRPNCFGAAKLRKILAASGQIQFVIKTPKLLSEQKQDAPTELFCEDVEVKEEVTEDAATGSKRPGFSECLESKLTRIDLANTLREQVQDLFNRKYGEALGIKYPVQVPYKRIKNNPDSVIIQGLPPGIPFRKPCTFGSQNLERILAVADKIHFTITRPFQGLIPKPAPRRVTLLKKSFGTVNEEEDLSCLGEKVVLREQVKELFNKKYGKSSPRSRNGPALITSSCSAGEALGLDRSVVVPYKLIRGSPESVEVSGLPDDVVFRNPNTYDIACLKKILQAADGVSFSVKTPLQPFAEICSQTCNTATEVSINRRKRKRVQESQRAPASADLALSTNQIPVMQWPMYMVDYSGVNMQVPGQVHY